jgi:acyl-coenzyme A synthetase/AMP-(fatty) acid ligase
VPDAKVLWQIVNKEKVTAFGLSPRLIAMTMQA